MGAYNRNVKMTREENLRYHLNLFVEKLKSNQPFSIVKIGDGEINSMRDVKGENIDRHPYSSELGKGTRDSFKSLCEKQSYICDWFYSNPPINQQDRINMNYYNSFISDNKLNVNFVKPFELLMLGWGNMEMDSLSMFYSEIKRIDRKTVYVGPERMSGLADLLSLDSYISIPLVNAFSSYDKILNSIIDEIEDHAIILFSVGLMSPLLINSLLEYNSSLTMLDVGSGLDPLFVGRTRGPRQADKQQALNYLGM